MEFIFGRGCEKMKKIGIKRTAAFFMGICMLVGMLPVEAYAVSSGDSTVYSINLNQQGVIAGLNSPNETGTEWSGSKIYFGKYSNTPLLWRVLETDNTNN